jgi:hypothetical protein
MPPMAVPRNIGKDRNANLATATCANWWPRQGAELRAAQRTDAMDAHAERMTSRSQGRK